MIDRNSSRQAQRRELQLVMALACASAVGCGAHDSAREEQVAEVGQSLGERPPSALLSDLARKSLIISGLEVVNDDTRNTPDPCLAQPSATPKKWDLGYLLQQASSTAPTPDTASAFVSAWLNTWSTQQFVNGQQLYPQGLGAKIKDQWLTKSGNNGYYKMQYAPYRLSAIVPRFDLRKKRRFGEGLAGELRFVYGYVDLNETSGPDNADNVGGCATVRQSSLILEYAVDKANENDVVAWANSWKALSQMQFGSSDYLTELQRLTESVVAAGKGTPFKKPNGSELLRIRVVENPAAEGKWTLREWTINRTTKLPEPVTVKQSPMIAQRIEGSSYVGTWANANAAAILNDTYVVPDTFPWGPRMLGAEDVIDSNGGTKREWRVGFNDGEVRHLFNLGTCNGCHSTETGTSFSHIETRWRHSEAPLSGFLLGVWPNTLEPEPFFVVDPVDQSTVRYFNEAAERESDLLALADGWAQWLPTGITNPAHATYFKWVNWQTGKCLDISAGPAMAMPRRHQSTARRHRSRQRLLSSSGEAGRWQRQMPASGHRCRHDDQASHLLYGYQPAGADHELGVLRAEVS
jgi:hypothetical protein